MATVVNFQGKDYIEPGSYAATVYNPTSVTNVANFGNVMIIDTGLSINGTYEFAGGSGVKGKLNQGLKSVYEFQSYEDFLAFMGGGLVADIAEKMFTPIQGAAGIPKLYYVRAATTVPASIVLTFSAGNTITLECKNEGIVGNGVAVEGVLKAGYSGKIIAGSTVDKFKLQIYRGTFKGVDADGEPFGVYGLANANPVLVVESPEFANQGQLFAWAQSNKSILSHFVVSTAGAEATVLKAIDTVLASGGTTVFNADGEYDEVLEAISELDVTFFLCTNLNAADGKGVDVATNAKLFTFLKTEAKFKQFMVVPGGEDDSDLFGEANTSQAIAKFYDSSQAIVAHGAPLVVRKDRNGTKKLSTIYFAADVIGLNAGGSPQTPITFKRIGYQSFVYDLKKRERENALQAGILHARNISGFWCINQGITTLLENKNTYAADGQSFELSIELIKAQLNKELILEGQVRFIGQTAAQASPESIKNFAETKLSSFVAYPGNDNLLITWKNVKVTALNGDFFISYDFVPNIPVNKTFFVGNVLDFKQTV